MRSSNFPRSCIALGALATLALLEACRTEAPAPSAPPNAQAAAPKFAAQGRSLARATCTLKPSRMVKLKARIGGEIASVSVVQGDRVAVGQVLATMDIRDLQIKLERASIDSARISEKLEWIRYQVTRAQKIVEAATVHNPAGQGYVPQYGAEMSALHDRNHELSEAESSYKAAQIDIEEIKQQIDKSKVRAPMQGIVLSRFAEPGMIVGSGSESYAGGDVLFEVADPSSMNSLCVIREAESTSLRQGDAVDLILDGHEGTSLAARIETVAPLIVNDAGISRREFVLQFDARKAPFPLVSGMNGIARIEAE